MKRIFITTLSCLLMFTGLSESVERKKGDTWNENIIFRRNVTTEFNDIPNESNILLDYTVKSGAVYTATQNRSQAQNRQTELSNVTDFYNGWFINFCGQERTITSYVPSESSDGVVISKFTLESAFDEDPANGSNMRLIDPDGVIDEEQVVFKVDSGGEVQIGGENAVALIHNGEIAFGENALIQYDVTDETNQFFVDLFKPVKTGSINVSTLCTPFSPFAANLDPWLTKIGIFLDTVPAGTKMRVFLEGEDTLDERYPLIENVTIDEFRQGLGDPVSVSTYADENTWNLTEMRIPAITRTALNFTLTFAFSDSDGDPVFFDVPVDTSITDFSFFRRVRTDDVVFASGTSITLDSAASPTDDDYNGMRLYIGGEFRDIIDYDEISKIATVDSAYTTTPSVSDEYIIKIAFLRPMMVFEHKLVVKSTIQDKHNRRDLSFSDNDSRIDIGTVNYIDTTGGETTFNILGQERESVGAWFEIIDKEGTFDTNNVIIEFGGFDAFEGVEQEDFIADEKGVRYLFRYVDVPFGWTVDIINDDFVDIDGDTMTGDLEVPDEAFGINWDNSLEVPTKKDIFDQFRDISVKVTKTTDQSIPRIILTMVTWNSEEYDTDGMHDNVTNNSRITFQTAGKYSILAQSEWGINSGGFRFMDIMKNGVDSIARVRDLADNASEHNISFVGEFVVGDYIQLEVFQDTGGNLDFESGAIIENTYLEAHKID